MHPHSRAVPEDYLYCLYCEADEDDPLGGLSFAGGDSARSAGNKQAGGKPFSSAGGGSKKAVKGNWVRSTLPSKIHAGNQNRW